MKKPVIFFFIIILLLAGVSFGFMYAQFAQAVDGIVRDAETNEPLSGATVVCCGVYCFSGGATGLDGYYRILGNHNGHKLVFSYIGYKPDTVEVSFPRETINVFLSPDSLE